MNQLDYIIHFAEQNNEAAEIIRECIDLTMASMDRDYYSTGLVSKFSMPSDYTERNKVVKETVLNFCAAKCGIRPIISKTDLAIAFSNTTFEALYNSIIAETLMGVMVRSQSPAILGMANIEEVDIGESYTWNIETKGLPIAQRGSYGSNVALLDSFATESITVAPKVWSIGTVLDYTRILANGYDFGKEIARVAMGILYTQYKLVVGAVFSTTGTPIYKPTFDAKDYVTMGDDLTALNGGSGVTAYGTRAAWQSINALATQGGFTTKDEYIRNNFLQKIYGIDSAVLDQATDFSSPLVAGAPERLVPNDKIILLSSVGDKPAKLVRENYIRVIRNDQTSGAQFRTSYRYLMAFEVALATQAHYGIQGV